MILRKFNFFDTTVYKEYTPLNIDITLSDSSGREKKFRLSLLTAWRRSDGFQDIAWTYLKHKPFGCEYQMVEYKKYIIKY